MPRIRTINGIVKEIHDMDPSSQVSKNFIRNLVITGRVKSVRAGTKYLIDLEHVLQYFANPIEQETDVIEYGKLRKVKT